MGTKGTHNRLEKTLGSVTTGVIRGASCSVWVIPEHAHIKEIRKVAYAAEMRESDPFYLQKAMAILPSAEVELHVVHVKDGKIEPAMVSLHDFEHVFNKHAANTKIAVHELEGSEVTEALDSFVETNEVDLLMMFAPEHTMIDRLFHRSTTKRMALETHVPLLLIKRQDQS
jgi:nucleotide-binding universal stress UspA family protein